MAALRAGKATAFGFINAKTIDGADHEDVLRVWREAGLPLGNHAFSHMDLHKNTAEAFLADVAANEPVLERLMGKEDWRWFRFPYLNAGETIEKRRAVEAALAQKGYRVAEVTIDFADWALPRHVRALPGEGRHAGGRLAEEDVPRGGRALDRRGAGGVARPLRPRDRARDAAAPGRPERGR